MVRLGLLTYRLVTYAVAFLAFGYPNILLAEDCICRKIGLGLCVPDPASECACQLYWNEWPNGAFGNEYPDVTVLSPKGECFKKRSYRPSASIRLIILETGYSLLKDIGGEKPGYGLYSYALAVNDSDRSAIFLSDVFSEIPPVEDTAVQRPKTNVFYIPLKNNKAGELSEGLKMNRRNLATLTTAYAKSFYDYKMSLALLDHLCSSPAEEIKAVCEGGLSRGPYIFTFAKPASEVTPVPPPFLFMDLSDVHERAFLEIIAAFRAQVKREDISDHAKIDTLRLKLLSIVLTAADFVVPVQKAMADIVHVASARPEGEKK